MWSPPSPRQLQSPLKLAHPRAGYQTWDPAVAGSNASSLRSQPSFSSFTVVVTPVCCDTELASPPAFLKAPRAALVRVGIHTSAWTRGNAERRSKAPRTLCALLVTASGVTAAPGALFQWRWQHGQRERAEPAQDVSLDRLRHGLICAAALNEHCLKGQIKEMSVMLTHFCPMYQCLMFEIMGGGRRLIPKLN